jgi:hypothetical protein
VMISKDINRSLERFYEITTTLTHVGHEHIEILLTVCITDESLAELWIYQFSQVLCAFDVAVMDESQRSMRAVGAERVSVVHMHRYPLGCPAQMHESSRHSTCPGQVRELRAAMSWGGAALLMDVLDFIQVGHTPTITMHLAQGFQRPSVRAQQIIGCDGRATIPSEQTTHVASLDLFGDSSAEESVGEHGQDSDNKDEGQRLPEGNERFRQPGLECNLNRSE